MREVGRAEHASTEQLSALLDGRPEPDELVFLAAHVDQCVVCSHELAELRTVRDLLRALPVYLPPRSFTIPIETVPPVRRFGVLIPLTRVLGTVAAVLCVVLFSVDAMQTGYDAPMAVPEGGAGAMQLTTRATMEAAKPAAPRAAARSAADADTSEDAAAKIPNAPAEAAAPPAPASKPAAAFAPAATQGPLGTPIQVIANTVTATPPGLAARPAAETARTTDAASTRAEGAAPAPQAPPPAAAAAQAKPAIAPQSSPPAAAQAAPAAAPAQPAAAQQAPGAAAKPRAPEAPPAPQPTSAAFAPGPPAPTSVPGGAPQAAEAPRPAAPATVASPWLSPIRLWSLAFALIAAALLIASIVLSRLSRARSGPSDEWSRS